MELYIDDREDNERINAIKNEFNSHIEVKRLLAGDILIYQNNGPIICIETKTIQDFIQSCRNRQIQKEALNMKRLYAFSYIIVCFILSGCHLSFSPLLLTTKSLSVIKVPL